jgi:hypothetical protein
MAILAALEGLPVLAWLGLIPSDSSSAFIWGLSKQRLVLLAICLLLFIALACLAVIIVKSPCRLITLEEWLRKYLIERHNLVPVALSALYIAIFGVAVTIFSAALSPDQYGWFWSWAGYQFSTLHIVILRILPFIAWASALALECFLLIVIRFGSQFKDRAFWQTRPILVTGVCLLAATATLIHWTILAFQLEVFKKIPGWYWAINAKPVTIRTALFGVLMAIFIAGAWFVLRQPQKPWRNLILLFFVGYAIQAGMGVVEGQGIESLRQKYFTSAHRSYAILASQNNGSIIDAVRDYEKRYGQRMFVSTKPPGLVTVYIALDKGLQIVNPQPDSKSRLQALSNFIAWSFPFISMLFLFFFYFFVNKIAVPSQNPNAGYLASIFYIAAPNIVLLTLFLDQAVYPAVFLAGVTLIIFTFRRQSILLALLTGCFLYTTIFFTYSMIPLYGFTGLFAILDWWVNRSERKLAKVALLLATAGAGTVLLFFLFRYFLNYDFFLRYKNAMAVVYNYDYYLRVGLKPGQTSVSLIDRIGQTLTAMKLNNIEFATAVGFPVFTLFLVQGIKVVVSFFRKSAGQAEAIQAGLLGTFVALNLAGQTRGEAARLWMFWVPMVVMFAGIEFVPLLQRKRWLFYLLLAAQFITLMLTYQFQDLKM